MADEKLPITIEVPAAGNFSPLPTAPQQSRLKAFRRSWCDLIALPDTLPDLIYDLTTSITIPALLNSCWGVLPLPGFIRWGIVGVLIVSALIIWQLLEIPEIRGVLVIRLMLVVLGVVLGL